MDNVIDSDTVDEPRELLTFCDLVSDTEDVTSRDWEEEVDSEPDRRDELDIDVVIEGVNDVVNVTWCVNDWLSESEFDSVSVRETLPLTDTLMEFDIVLERVSDLVSASVRVRVGGCVSDALVALDGVTERVPPEIVVEVDPVRVPVRLLERDTLAEGEAEIVIE